MLGTLFRGNDQSGDSEYSPCFGDVGEDKEHENVPQDPLTDLVKEVDTGDNSMSEVVRVPESYDLEVSDQKHAGESQRNKAKQVMMDCYIENSIEIPFNPCDTSLVGVDQLSITPIAHMPVTKDWRIDLQPQSVIKHRWVYETSQPTIELLTAWCKHPLKKATREDNDLYKLLVMYCDLMQLRMKEDSDLQSLAEATSQWVYDTGQQKLPRISPFRLEDKSCLQAGSIDTNPWLAAGSKRVRRLLGQNGLEDCWVAGSNWREIIIQVFKEWG